MAYLYAGAEPGGLGDIQVSKQGGVVSGTQRYCNTPTRAVVTPRPGLAAEACAAVKAEACAAVNAAKYADNFIPFILAGGTSYLCTRRPAFQSESWDINIGSTYAMPWYTCTFLR